MVPAFNASGHCAGRGLPQLAITGTAQDDYVIAYDFTNTRLYWKVDATAMAGSGITSVASDTAFGGDGTAGDPLTMAVGGADFPIITLAKGGLGVANDDFPAVRTTLGLGTAATFNIGVGARVTWQCWELTGCSLTRGWQPAVRTGRCFR